MAAQLESFGPLDLFVRPDFRRRGVGSEFLRHAVTVLAEEGRRILIGETDEGSAGAAFCATLGLDPVKTDQLSLLRMTEVDRVDVDAVAAADHPGYRLVSWQEACPGELLEFFAGAKYAMNDAPVGDMDVADRGWYTEIVRGWERELRHLGRQQRVVAALHEASGEVAGFTEVELRHRQHALSEQGDTAVVAAHRGRGLGLWVKAVMLRQLHQARPDVTELLTGKAQMLRITVRLGYRPYVRLIEWQGNVPDLAARLDPARPGGPPIRETTTTDHPVSGQCPGGMPGAATYGGIRSTADPPESRDPRRMRTWAEGGGLGGYRLRMGALTVDGYRIESLTAQTWDAFADLAERHNGVWGGCWCTYFHLHPDNEDERRAIGHREFKRRLVEAGRARAALVFDGNVAVAWAEFGTVPELPNIHHRKEWEKGVAQLPDYRITCLFVDRGHRRAGMAEVAVRGAVALIAAAGGGLVEAYPHDLPEGKKTSASFLYNATRTMYERLGFSYERPKGKGNCVMSAVVPAATT